MRQIEIDGNAIFTSPDLHKALAEALSFPEYYGSNLDALYDCLTEIDQDTLLILNNWHHIEFHLKDYSGKAVYVFHCAQEDNPRISVILKP
jgi:ribonuclease inhibitor